MKISQISVLATLSGTVIFSGCFGQSSSGGNASGGTLSTSEIAIDSISGILQSTARTNLLETKTQENWDLIPSAYAGNACATPATGKVNYNCHIDSTGRSMTLSYTGCSFSNGSATWIGSQILTSSSNVQCGAYPSETNGSTLLRTFGANTTIQNTARKEIITLDTTQSSGYAFSVSGGALSVYSNPTTKRIFLNGLHLVANQPSQNNSSPVPTLWDFSISTSQSSPLSVNSALGNRVVNGTISVQNNLNYYTATIAVKDVAFSSTSSCCHPISGSLTTSFSGSQTGTETLTFYSTGCGSAKLTDSSGSSRAITLSYCF